MQIKTKRLFKKTEKAAWSGRQAGGITAGSTLPVMSDGHVLDGPALRLLIGLWERCEGGWITSLEFSELSLYYGLSLIICFICLFISRDSLASEMIGYGLDERGSSLGKDRKFFSFSPPQNLLCPPPNTPIRRVPGSISYGVSHPERESDHSPLSSYEVHSPDVSADVLKQRDNLTLHCLFICFSGLGHS